MARDNLELRACFDGLVTNPSSFQRIGIAGDEKAAIQADAAKPKSDCFHSSLPLAGGVKKSATALR
jgi:hypothetical protein